MIDQLTYNYTNNGNATNQIQNIADASPDAGSKGYKAGTYSYSYDDNGNMLADNSKGLTIAYNLLNLPQTNTLAAGTISYTYDATGRKLRKTSTIGSGTTSDYISGIQYTNGAIDFIQTEEGRALKSGTSYNYEYSLSDHLGNTRLSFDTHSGITSTTQQTDYMPFGMEITVGSVVSPKNEYLYNKKELQEELGQYDYGARFYDPVIGRWTSVDPLAEISRRFSPYTYGDDNSIRNIDVDGMWTEDAKGLHSDNAEEAQAAFKKLQATNQNQKPPKKKISNPNDRVKNAPHINKLTHWWEKLFASLDGGRDYNGITYDNDGNPEHITYNKLVFNIPFGINTEVRAGEYFTERILGFFVKSSVVVEAGTYTRTVSILANVENEKSLFQLLKAFESDAAAKGASNIVLKGTEVLNEKLFNPAVAARLGYKFEKLANDSFTLTKTLIK